MVVTIDLAMPLMDIGTIFLIVVLPALIFLMAPDSHQKSDSKNRSQTDAAKAEDFSVAPLAHQKCCSEALGKKYDGRFVKRLGTLPEELRAEVVQCLNLSEVAAVGASCQHLQQAVQAFSVWQTLGSRYGIQIESQCLNQAKESVRLAAWRMDFRSIKDLAIEVKRHPPGASAAPTSKLLGEASRFVKRLLPSDGDLAMELSELIRPSLNCHSSECANEAKDFLKLARRSHVPWVVLQDLESSYGHGLLQQNLFESCLRDHEDMLEQQLSALEASIEGESKVLMDFELDTLLEA